VASVAAGHFSHGLVISSPEAIPVIALEFIRNIWVAVFVAVVHIRSTVVVEVLSRTFHSILKSLLLGLCGNVAAAVLRLTDRLSMVAQLAVVVAHEMSHGSLIAAAKALAVRLTLVEGETGMTVLIPVVHIWPTVIVEVSSRAFYAVLKSAALNLFPLSRRRIPCVAILGICRMLTLGHSNRSDDDSTRGSEE
jgi:hypothetical protein